MLSSVSNRLISYALPTASSGPKVTTLAVGEESGHKAGGTVTTQAVGEEAGSLPIGATTEAVGEEGGTVTSMSLGEEAGSFPPGATTEAVGEEGGSVGGFAPIVSPETVAKVEELRMSEIPFQAVVSQINETLTRDKFLRLTLSIKKIADLANQLVTPENMQRSAGQVIKAFVDANTVPAGNAITTRIAAKPAPSSNDVVIGEGNFRQNVTVQNARIEGDTLVANVRFGGGFVKDHDIKLHWEGLFLESFPVQVPLTVVDHTVDPAEALLGREVRFNLKPLADAYCKAYQTTGGDMYLNVEGAGMIVYKFGAQAKSAA